MADVNNPQWWEGRDRQGTDRWELGRAAPPIVNWLDSPEAPPPGRAIVPGCGRGHEVLALAERGWEAVGIDFAPSAIQDAQAAAQARRLAGRASFRCMNVFDAPANPELAGRFDLVVEHTSYAAIDPARRDEYIDVLAALLRPGGVLVGLFFDLGREGGPPYSATPEEIRRYLGRRFEIRKLEPARDSVPDRLGFEHFVVARGGLEPPTQGL